MRKKLLWFGAPIVAVIAVVALLLFEPWRAFTSSELNEPSPIGASTKSGEMTGAPMTGAPMSGERSGPKLLSEGRFASQEHETSGKAVLIERPDGSRVLRIEGLASSDGPDLHIWLSEAKAGLEDWGAYDDGRYVALGELKATHGSHNYEVPASAEPDGLSSVVIWCDRFNVAFGSAPLKV